MPIYSIHGKKDPFDPLMFYIDCSLLLARAKFLYIYSSLNRQTRRSTVEISISTPSTQLKTTRAFNWDFNKTDKSPTSRRNLTHLASNSVTARLGWSCSNKTERKNTNRRFGYAQLVEVLFRKDPLHDHIVSVFSFDLTLTTLSQFGNCCTMVTQLKTLKRTLLRCAMLFTAVAPSSCTLHAATDSSLRVRGHGSQESSSGFSSVLQTRPEPKRYVFLAHFQLFRSDALSKELALSRLLFSFR
jgi:hypothetical protein